MCFLIIVSKCVKNSTTSDERSTKSWAVTGQIPCASHKRLRTFNTYSCRVTSPPTRSRKFKLRQWITFRYVISMSGGHGIFIVLYSLVLALTSTGKHRILLCLGMCSTGAGGSKQAEGGAARLYRLRLSREWRRADAGTLARSTLQLPLRHLWNQVREFTKSS